MTSSIYVFLLRDGVNQVAGARSMSRIYGFLLRDGVNAAAATTATTTAVITTILAEPSPAVLPLPGLPLGPLRFSLKLLSPPPKPRGLIPPLLACS